MGSDKQVFLQLPLKEEMGRGLLLGIARYLRQHNVRWQITSQVPFAGSYSADPPNQKFDGCIAILRQPANIEAAANRPYPTVNVSATVEPGPLPAVLPDNLHAGRLAAEHLLNLGLPNIAVCVSSKAYFRRQRAEGFIQTCRSRGREPILLQLDSMWDYATAAPVDDRLDQLLVTLPRPLGLATGSDPLAAMLLRRLDALGIRVPEGVAVVGTDNDELLCEFTCPSLSSVAIDFIKIGLRAAHLLDDLMAGKRPPAAPILLPCGPVVMRRSTSVTRLPDPELERAVDYMRQHVGEGIKVQDVVRALAIPRRSLERRFREHFGQTPLSMLHAIRAERAAELLRQTDLMLAEVATRTGYLDAKRFGVGFRACMGMSPREYRRQCRLRSSAPDHTAQV